VIVLLFLEQGSEKEILKKNEQSGNFVLPCFLEHGDSENIIFFEKAKGRKRTVGE
jgi:hypothetical protein